MWVGLFLLTGLFIYLVYQLLMVFQNIIYIYIINK